MSSQDALEQAEDLTNALRHAVESSDHTTLGQGTYSLEFLMLQLRCDDTMDSACEHRIAEQLRVDRYVWATIELDGDEVAGTLGLVVGGQQEGARKLRFPAAAPADELRKIASRAIQALVGSRPKSSSSPTSSSTPTRVDLTPSQPLEVLPKPPAPPAGGGCRGCALPERGIPHSAHTSWLLVAWLVWRRRRGSR